MIYVEELIGPDTVNTMPLETVRAFQEHGEVKVGSLTAGHRRGDGSFSPTSQPQASTTTTSSTTLEAEGVQKFADSFAELLDGIRAKVGSLASA